MGGSDVLVGMSPDASALHRADVVLVVRGRKLRHYGSRLHPNPATLLGHELQPIILPLARREYDFAIDMHRAGRPVIESHKPLSSF